MHTVAFPGLGIAEQTLNRVALEIGSWSIYWYGAIIGLGFVLAVLYCSKRAKCYGIREDDLLDMLYFAAPLAIVGARLYYIIFYLDLYKNEDGSLNFMQMVRIWDGGLAIYGAVIVSVITAFIFCKVKKVKFLALADDCVLGLLIGQCIGRWGNFVNIEAYGGETTLPWRMGIYEWVNGAWQYIEVHPTFLYESMWNLLGFIIIALIARKGRRFDGQSFASYFLWYGVGRGLIEGLRTDSLYFLQTPIRVSQVFGFATALIALIFLVYNLRKPYDPDNLWVNRVIPEDKPLEEKSTEDVAEEVVEPVEEPAETEPEEISRIALIFPEGNEEARTWADTHKTATYTEEYPLPEGLPQEEVDAMIESIKAREDLTEVLVWANK